MAHRADRIAGPMLRRRDADGRAKKPSSADDVQAALEAQGIHPAVVSEWRNEALRRNGLKSEETLRGDDYRAWRRASRKPFKANPVRKETLLRRLARFARKITRRNRK